MKLHIALLLALVVLYVPAVQAQNMTESSYDPGLDEVIEAEDTSQVAEANGLSYRNGSVLLVVELGTNELPEGYGIEVVQEYSNANVSLVEGYVPVENIRNLANDTAVEYVRPPSQPVAQNDSRNTTSDEDIDSDNISEGSSEENSSGNASDGQPTDGFTAIVGLLSLAAVALYVRWS